MRSSYIVNRSNGLALFDTPIEFTFDVLDDRRGVLKYLIFLPVIIDRTASAKDVVLSDVRSIYRLDKIPMVIAVYEPTESDRRIVKQILVPVIMNGINIHAADDGPDDLEFYIAGKRSFGTDRSDKVRCVCGRCQRFEKAQIALIYIE